MDKNKIDVREKAIYKGVGKLSDQELLSLIFKRGSKKDNLNEICDNTLKVTNNFELISRLSYHELVKIDGITKIKALDILAAFELVKRSLEVEKVCRKQIMNPSSIVDFLKLEIGKEVTEYFYVLYLNNLNEVVKYSTIAKGSLERTSFDFKEIFRKSLLFNANKIILAHNHPSNNPYPSSSDISTTHKLMKSAKILNIEILDHLIVGATSYYSFSEHNFFAVNSEM